MNKEAFIGMGLLIAAAFKDIKGVYSDLREEGDGVIMNFHFEGTHTGDLDLSAMGLGVIPASGKMIVWPEVSAKYMVEGDKIIANQDITAGTEWFLAPLGFFVSWRSGDNPSWVLTYLWTNRSLPGFFSLIQKRPRVCP